MGERRWHSGLLNVAFAMADKLAEVLDGEFHNKPKEKCSILFTGHSAGGAMAQIFYAMGGFPKTKLGSSLKGKVQPCHREIKVLREH